MIFALVIGWLALAQTQHGPADRFVGAWENGPFHIMTEAESERFDPCACPMFIHGIDDDTILIDAGRGRRIYDVTAHGDILAWTLQSPVSLPDEPYAARIGSDGRLQRTHAPSLEPDWSRAGTHARCLLPDDFDPVQPYSRSRRCT